MREIVSIHVGQAGVQLGSSCWMLYCMEHGLDFDGMIIEKEQEGHQPSEGSDVFFSLNNKGKYCPRAVLVDLEPSVVDEVRKSELKNLFNPSLLLSGNEDAANNYARGHYSIGRGMAETAMDPIRRLVDACDRLQGFLIFHSSGGGTGSGLNSLLMENLTVYFGKKSKMEVSIFPSAQMSTAVVEPYNAMLQTHSTMDHTDCALVADNEALFNMCVRYLEVEQPTYRSLNVLLAQAISSVTASLRFEGVLNTDFADYQTNLVPYPKIHFPVISYSPIISEKNYSHQTYSVTTLTSECFGASNQMAGIDPKDGHYMACCLLYRGDVIPKDVNYAITELRKKKRGIDFVDWSPTGFKVGINCKLPVITPKEFNLSNINRSLCMLSNTTAIRSVFCNLYSKFYVMFQKKAFLHWYFGEGMEENEFIEAKETIEMLDADYREVNESQAFEEDM